MVAFEGDLVGQTTNCRPEPIEWIVLFVALEKASVFSLSHTYSKQVVNTPKLP